MTIAPVEWFKIQKAIEDGDLFDLITDMLNAAYNEGKHDGMDIDREDVKP
jgi:hypothetical protein